VSVGLETDETFRYQVRCYTPYINRSYSGHCTRNTYQKSHLLLVFQISDYFIVFIIIYIVFYRS